MTRQKLAADIKKKIQEQFRYEASLLQWQRCLLYMTGAKRLEHINKELLQIVENTNYLVEECSKRCTGCDVPTSHLHSSQVVALAVALWKTMVRDKPFQER
jgi:hypothetical protein